MPVKQNSSIKLDMFVLSSHVKITKIVICINFFFSQSHPLSFVKLDSWHPKSFDGRIP